MTMQPTISKDAWLKFAETLRVGASGSLTSIATGLQRPECVLTHSSGRVFVSDKRGGITTIWPDGRQHLSGTSNLLPNGFAMQRDGSFLVANLGPGGGVWRIAPDGQTSPWMTEVDGKVIDRVNFVGNDHESRVWVCISATDGSDKYPLRTASGSIILRDATGTRVVAEGLHYTNECRVSADGNFMYVNETFGRRLSRFRIAANGELTGRETIATFSDGDFPDGLTLDAEGGAWVVCVGSNRLCRVAPDGEKQTIIDDAVSKVAAELEAAFEAGTLDRPQLSAARGHRLSNVTSLAFGGPDLRTAYMGCLAGDTLMSFRSPVAGFAPVHWNW
jgi:sugar lactone lactonase YvrE